MKRLLLILPFLLFGSASALAQDASPTPPPKVNNDDAVSVGGHVFQMPEHCPLAATVVGRTEDLSGQHVTLQEWDNRIEGWVPGSEFETDAVDPDNPIHDAHVGDLFCLGVGK